MLINELQLFQQIQLENNELQNKNDLLIFNENQIILTNIQLCNSYSKLHHNYIQLNDKLISEFIFNQNMIKIKDNKIKTLQQTIIDKDKKLIKCDEPFIRCWKPKEHKIYLKYFENNNGNIDYNVLSKLIKTRTTTQIRTHHQKYLLKLKLSRNYNYNNNDNNNKKNNKRKNNNNNINENSKKQNINLLN